MENATNSTIILRKKIISSLILFFILTFLISWSVDFFRVLVSASQNIPASNESYFLHFMRVFDKSGNVYIPIFFMNLLFGPSIAAFLVTLLFSGRKGIVDFLKRITENSFSLKWFLIAHAIHFFLVGFSFTFGYVLSGFPDLKFTPLVPLYYAPYFLLYLVIFTGLAEEIGWRGFALPRLQKIFSADRASIILGIVWALWHVPLSIYSNIGNPGVIPVLLVGLIAGTIGWTYVVSWFFNNSKSLPLTMYLHGFGNFLLSYGILSMNVPMANMLYGFAPWIIVIILEKRYGKNYLLPN